MALGVAERSQAGESARRYASSRFWSARSGEYRFRQRSPSPLPQPLTLTVVEQPLDGIGPGTRIARRDQETRLRLGTASGSAPMSLASTGTPAAYASRIVARLCLIPDRGKQNGTRLSDQGRHLRG